MLKLNGDGKKSLLYTTHSTYQNQSIPLLAVVSEIVLSSSKTLANRAPFAVSGHIEMCIMNYYKYKTERVYTFDMKSAKDFLIGNLHLASVFSLQHGKQ